MGPLWWYLVAVPLAVPFGLAVGRLLRCWDQLVRALNEPPEE